jgi:hypothetical protein
MGVPAGTAKIRTATTSKGRMMALKIVKLSDDLYSVSASPPDVREEWHLLSLSGEGI